MVIRHDEPSRQARLNAENLAYITVPDVKEAYLLFMKEAEARNIETSVLESSAAKPLRFYRLLKGEPSYFFSCDRTRTNLRCYVRTHALRAWPELRQILLEDPTLEARELNGEIQVIVSTPAESLRIVEIVFDRPEFDTDAGTAVDAPLRLELVADAAATSSAFAAWLAALTDGAESSGDGYLLPSKGTGFRILRPIEDDELRVEFWVGDSASAAVQINEPNVPGTENPRGGLAVDEAGSRYIVRQGVLHRNHASERIEAPEFARRTGLAPVDMQVDGRPSRREWHLVTPLDGLSDDAIVFNTIEFVTRCWRARTWNDATQVEEERLAELFGSEEQGGWFNYTPDPTPRHVLRSQGEVWQALSRQLGFEGIKLAKPRHARGYEVDAEVVTRERSLLIEIKSGVAAADYYCGVGQLMLYAALLPRLAGHEKVLLLPESRASVALEEALGPLGILVHRYRLAQTPAVEVRFSAAFLQLCGMSAEKAADLKAF
jgi:hypothetical protein